MDTSLRDATRWQSLRLALTATQCQGQGFANSKSFGFWIKIQHYIASEEGGFESISSKIVIGSINPPLQTPDPSPPIPSPLTPHPSPLTPHPSP